MIKNKTPNIKIIKNKVKNILDFQINFCFTKYQRTIYKTIHKNCFSKLF